MDHFIDNKRKGDDIENPGSKTRRMDKKRCVDLIVLGLPWKSTEEDMRKYFSQFGELLLVQVKIMIFNFLITLKIHVESKIVFFLLVISVEDIYKSKRIM